MDELLYQGHFLSGVDVKLAWKLLRKGESASAKIEDIKSALRELGLGEDVN